MNKDKTSYIGGLTFIDGNVITDDNGNPIREYIITNDNKVICAGEPVIWTEVIGEDGLPKNGIHYPTPSEFLKDFERKHINSNMFSDAYSNNAGLYDFITHPEEGNELPDGKVIVERINCVDNLDYCTQLDELVTIGMGRKKY